MGGLSFKSQWEYLLVRVSSGIKSDASRNLLGYAWWIIEPILYMSAFYFVFEFLLKRGGEGYIYYLLIGVIFWQWFSLSVSKSALCILSSSALINQTYIPKYLLPLATVIGVTFRYSIVFLLLVVFFLLSIEPSILWLYMIPILCVGFFLLLACSFVVAALVPFFPDIRILLPPALQLTMFSSGIFYYLSDIREPIRDYMLLNPVANLISQLRVVILENQLPDFLALFYVALFSFVMLFLALYLLHRFDRYYPKVA